MPEHTPAPTPSRAVYGFVMYLSFRIFFIVYVIWAVLPEKYFKAIGITFLPQRHWAITVPVYLLTVLTTVAFVIYPSLGLCMTPTVDDMRTIKDKVGSKKRHTEVHLDGGSNGISTSCVCKEKDKCSMQLYNKIQHTFVNNTIPILRDLEIWDVSDHLYLNS